MSEHPTLQKILPSLYDDPLVLESGGDYEPAVSTIFRQFLLMAGFGFGYGLSMGFYHGIAQALAAGIKVSALFALSLAICFPALFVIQHILGSKLGPRQMLSVILSGLVLTTAIIVSFIPIVVIFLLTGANYYFLQLLHISVFTLAGVFGMISVVSALRRLCEKKSVYPQTGVVVFRFWVVILAFVAVQLAWNMRPFLGDRGEPFQFFRSYDGNFYTALIYSVRQLSSEETIEPSVTSNPQDVTFAEDTITAIDIFKVDTLGK